MKKLIIAGIVATSLFSQASYANNYFGSTPSEMSVIIIIASPLLSSAAIATPFAELSRTSTAIRVTKVEQKEANKTRITGVANNNPIEFDADTKVVIKAKVKENDNINVKDAKLGYVLEANNVALGIVPNAQNSQNFKQEKLN